MEERQEKGEVDQNRDQKNIPNRKVNMIVGGPLMGSQLSNSSSGIDPKGKPIMSVQTRRSKVETLIYFSNDNLGGILTLIPLTRTL